MRNSQSKIVGSTAAPKLIGRAETLARVGNPSYSTLWEWMKDGKFPLPVELGPSDGRRSKIAWYESEVDHWIATRPRRKIGKGLHRHRPRKAAAAAIMTALTLLLMAPSSRADARDLTTIVGPTSPAQSDRSLGVLS